MASRALSSTRKQYFSRPQISSTRWQDSSDRKTRTLTLTNLKQPDRKVIGHSCSTVPLTRLWCDFHVVQRYKTHFHRDLLGFAHEGHHIHFLKSKKDVRRCCSTVSISCCASGHHFDESGRSCHNATMERAITSGCRWNADPSAFRC